MKRTFVLFLVFAVILGGMITSASVTGALTEETEGIYTYTVEHGEATITDCAENASGFITVPATLGGYPVTVIGAFAFRRCEGITGFSLPSGIKAIEWKAFEDTAFYENTVNWENGSLYIGEYLIKVKEEVEGDYVVKAGTTLIADSAFAHCELITSLSLTNSLRYIGRSAFNWTDAIEEVRILNLEDWLAITFADFSANPLGSGAYLFIGGQPVTDLVIPDGTTKIGVASFCYDQMTSITIPDSVTEIGAEAFFHCQDLEKVVIEDLTAWCNIKFADASANPISTNDAGLYLGEQLLEDVIVPEGTTRIGEYAFYSYNSLRSVNIPKSVTYIDATAFRSCHSLSGILVDAENEEYSEEYGVLFDKNKETLLQYPPLKVGGAEYSVPDTVRTIEAYAFYNNNNLTAVTIPDRVEIIGKSAFDGCDKLARVELGSGVKTIGHDAFNSCRSLTEILIPDNVETIGDCAFSGCDKLARVELGSGVKTIGHDAFDSCRSLTEILIPDSVETIEVMAFYNCRKLEKVTIGKGVKTIRSSAFEGCEALKRLKFHSGLTILEDSVFQGCQSLSCLILPSGLETILWRMVNDCPALEEIYFCGTKAEWNQISIDEDNEGLAEKEIIFVPEQSSRTKVSEDKRTLKVNVFHFEEEGTVILGLYKGKRLVEVQSCSYVDEELVFETTADYDTVRIMVWDDTLGLIPLMNQETLLVS